MINDEHKNFFARTIWSTVLSLNLAIFIVTKISFLKTMLVSRSILQNPHDTLLFIDEMEQLLVTPICTVIVVYDLVNNDDPPFTRIIPNCGIRTVFPLHMNVMIFGGMAIALMRYITIRYTQIIARYGEVKIMGAILFLWHAVLLVNTYLTAVNSRDTYKSRCYNKEESTINYHTGPIFLLACGTEFAIYFSICHYVYKSDIEVRHFISSESYKRRKRKNAFNMFGHTIHFFIELILILGAFILIKTNIISTLRVWNQFCTTLMSISKLLSCKPMRKKWTHLFIYLTEKSRYPILRILKNPKITPDEHHDNVNMEMLSN